MWVFWLTIAFSHNLVLNFLVLIVWLLQLGFLGLFKHCFMLTSSIIISIGKMVLPFQIVVFMIMIRIATLSPLIFM
jgi:hypothetical protein